MKRTFLIVLGCAAILLAAGLPTRGQGPQVNPGAATRPAIPTTQARNERIAIRLAGPVPLRFDTNRLTSVLDFYRNVVGVSFAVDWAALEKAGVTQDTPVSLELKNVPADLGLRYILRSADPKAQLIYRIEDGAVVITTLKPYEKLPDPPPADRAATKKLGNAVSAQFDANFLLNVIDYLRNTSGLNIFVDWASVEAAGIDRTKPITLQLDKTPTSTALDQVLQAAGGDKLQWTVEGNVVVIAAKKGALAATQPAPK
jgi:hypothetical protein